MSLLTTSLLSFVAVGVRAICLLLVNKVLAIFVGPTGYALVGQFQNVLSSITAVASAGVNTGITKYTAEYGENISRQKDLWSTGLIIGVCSTALTSIGILVFAYPLSNLLFKNEDFAIPIIWSAICLPLFALNTLFLAILNGKKLIQKFVIVNICNSISLLAAVAVGSWVYGVKGALIGLVIGQSASGALAFLLCWGESWFNFSSFLKRFDPAIAVKLFNFSLMAIATSILGPLSQMVVRGHLIAMEGVAVAGYWEAITRISGAYLMFIAMPLTIYYVPRISEINTKIELKKEIISGYKILIPIALMGSSLIYIARDSVIEILFSSEFLPARDLFAWQMIGDVFRACGWLLSFYLLGKAMTRYFILLEVFINILFITLSWLGIFFYQVTGLTIAYAFNNLIYLLILCFIVKLDISKRN
jgi:PST family polysaccharide transporter